DALDLVDDRDRRIARPHEISMQRMRVTALDRARRSDQRLADHLAAEDPLPARLRAAPAEEIVLERLEIEDGQELSDRARHFSSAPAGPIFKSRHSDSLAGRV